jgi:hypothetical protein
MSRRAGPDAVAKRKKTRSCTCRESKYGRPVLSLASHYTDGATPTPVRPSVRMNHLQITSRNMKKLF